MRRVIVAAALIASGAVFAADFAKDRLDPPRAASPILGVVAPAARGAQHGDDTLKPAATLRFRLADDADADMTYDPRWRVPEAFGYHPATFDSAEPDPAAAGGSRFRDESPPREGRSMPRVQF
jgi:hypothetical protein